MGGFEHFTVIEPPSSKEVRAMLTKAEHDSSCAAAKLTLRPERTASVVPLHDTSSEVHVTVVAIHSHPTTTVYLCTTADGATLTVIVSKSKEDSLPARATLVRGALPSTP